MDWTFQKTFFSVLGDKVSDISKQDQLNLVLSFVDEFDQVREEFLEIVWYSGETFGEALLNIILSTLTSHGLDLQLMRGQGYDGADTMSGCIRGVTAPFQLWSYT